MQVLILKQKPFLDLEYYVSQLRERLQYEDYWEGRHSCRTRNATPEEIQELNNQLAAEGKCWNPNTMQIEKLRWKPKQDEIYFTIVINGYGMYISEYTNGEDLYDKNNYKLGNCFKTKEEAEAKLEQIKKLLSEN